MLVVLTEPARTVVAVAALAGLRRGEIRGLLWENYTPTCDTSTPTDTINMTPITNITTPTNTSTIAILNVTRSIWGRHIGEPKTKKSKAPVPVIASLAKMLDLHRFRSVIRR